MDWPVVEAQPLANVLRLEIDAKPEDFPLLTTARGKQYGIAHQAVKRSRKGLIVANLLPLPQRGRGLG
jgi:hypothetical protein